MSDTLVAFVDDLTAIVKERNALREENEKLKAELGEFTQFLGVPRRVMLGVNHGIKGKDRPNRRKLDESEVSDIRYYRRTGMGVTEIARMYDVHHATISRIIRGVYHKDAA